MLLGDIKDNLNLPKLTAKTPEVWRPISLTLGSSFAMTSNNTSDVQALTFSQGIIKKIRFKTITLWGVVHNAGVPRLNYEYDITVIFAPVAPISLINPLLIESTTSADNNMIVSKNGSPAPVSMVFDVATTGQITLNIQCWLNGVFAAHNCNWYMMLDCEYSI